VGNEGFDDVIGTEEGRPMAKPDRLLASARENRSYGSGLRGIQLFFSSPLVGMQEEFDPLAPRLARILLRRKTYPEKREGEEDRLVLLVLERDDHLLLGYLD